MMFNISRASIPCPFGGISYTVQSRYVVEIGSAHSAENFARSSAVIVPLWRFMASKIFFAISPL